jgi:hypothetical protein
MKTLRTFLTLYFYILRTRESIIGVSDNYSTHPFQPLSEHYILPDSTLVSDNTSTISYSHLTFYNNFVTSYIHVIKKQRSSYTSFHCKNFVPVSLLLCGDIHPLPGPVDNVSQSQYNIFNKRGLHFLHLNTRSLLPKIDELRIIARKTKAAFLGLTETWLDDTISDNEISIQNYNIIRKDRNRHGGGVCIYIRSDLAFNPRTDLSCDNLEAVFCELLLPKS